MSWFDWNYTRTNENMSQLYGHLRNDKKSESPLMAYANYYQNNSNNTILSPNWYTTYSNAYTQQPEQVVNYQQEYLKVSSPPNRLLGDVVPSRVVHHSERTRTAHPFLRISSSQQSFDDESLKHSDSGRIEDFHGSSQRLYEDYVRRQAEKKKFKLEKKKDGGEEMVNSEFHTIYELVEQFG